MKHIAFLSAGLLVAAFTVPASAQQSLLAEYYGQGVHAYNAGNSQQALSHFNAAVRGGSKDPRLFYFRGLTLARMGRTYDAQRDFRFAAKFEARAAGEQHYDVGRALERIQGGRRIALEQYRRRARMQVLEQQMARDRERYEQLQQSKPRVLRGGAPAEEMPQPPRAGADPTNPFPKSGDAMGPGGITDAPPKATPKTEPDGVFGADDPMDGATPTPAPMGDDPLEDKMDPEINPFGDDAPPAGGAEEPNPFGN